MGAGKFNSIWHGPYVVNCLLEKGSYESVDYEGTALVEPRNGLYIKKYYALSSARARFLYIIVHFLHYIVRSPYGDRVC